MENTALAQALADTATIAIRQQRTLEQTYVERDQLQAALTSRIVIEQAEGILAERWHTSPDDTFTRFRTYARTTACASATSPTRSSTTVRTAAVRSEAGHPRAAPPGSLTLGALPRAYLPLVFPSHGGNVAGRHPTGLLAPGLCWRGRRNGVRTTQPRHGSETRALQTMRPGWSRTANNPRLQPPGSSMAGFRGPPATPTAIKDPHVGRRGGEPRTPRAPGRRQPGGGRETSFRGELRRDGCHLGTPIATRAVLVGVAAS
ncbi:ANTAR domain-containing protein [Streptomyces sp. Edi4]|uniref:ANTAR domain-containing protein n=1 Tax=Streptomyces sp. Edi4 TaxID=3162527 RepID=UPI0033058D5B